MIRLADAVKDIAFDELEVGEVLECMSDKGWEANITVGKFYKVIGKFRPSSKSSGWLSIIGDDGEILHLFGTRFRKA